MEILKGNKLIAEWMGYSYIPFNEDRKYLPGWWIKDVTLQQQSLLKLNQHLYLGRATKDLRYYNSLDWLLPVIEKIKKDEEFTIIGGNGDPWEVSIETTGYHYMEQAFCKDDNLIKAIWSVCIEYIERINTGNLRVAKK